MVQISSGSVQLSKILYFFDSVIVVMLSKKYITFFRNSVFFLNHHPEMIALLSWKVCIMCMAVRIVMDKTGENHSDSLVNTICKDRMSTVCGDLLIKSGLFCTFNKIGESNTNTYLNYISSFKKLKTEVK